MKQDIRFKFRVLVHPPLAKNRMIGTCLWVPDARWIVDSHLMSLAPKNDFSCVAVAYLVSGCDSSASSGTPIDHKEVSRNLGLTTLEIRWRAHAALVCAYSTGGPRTLPTR